MTEPLNIQQNLAAEQAAVNIMSDTVEAALAGASLRWKASALKGEKGAADELMKAEAALREYREGRNPIGTGPGTAPGEWFRTEREAYNYLLSLGTEISVGKFNTDKNAGRLTTDGKKISKFSVLQYSMSLKKDRQQMAGINSADIQAQREQDEARKAKAEADLKEMQAENMKRRLSADWAHRTEVYTTWAGLMGNLYTACQHNFSYNTGAIITVVNGDQNRTASLDEILTEVVNKSFNEIGMLKRIEAVFRSEEIEEEESHDAD